MSILFATFPGLLVLSLAGLLVAQAPVTFQLLDTIMVSDARATGGSDDGSTVIGAIDFSFGTNALQLTVPNNATQSGLPLTSQGVGFGGQVGIRARATSSGRARST